MNIHIVVKLFSSVVCRVCGYLIVFSLGLSFVFISHLSFYFLCLQYILLRLGLSYIFPQCKSMFSNNLLSMYVICKKNECSSGGGRGTVTMLLSGRLHTTPAYRESTYSNSRTWQSVNRLRIDTGVI